MKILAIETWAPHPSAAPWGLTFSDVPTIFADVDLGDGYRTWNGGCFRDVNWMQRRPHLYGAEIDIHCYGSLAELPS